LGIHAYCSIIHNNQATEADKIPHIDEWIKKMWHLHTIKFYSAIKKNEILFFAGKWMELENIILNEVSQVFNFLVL
jgi:hypothetical protein